MMQMANREAAALARGPRLPTPDFTCRSPGGAPPSVLSSNRTAASGRPQSSRSGVSLLLVFHRRCLAGPSARVLPQRASPASQPTWDDDHRADGREARVVALCRPREREFSLPKRESVREVKLLVSIVLRIGPCPVSSLGKLKCKPPLLSRDSKPRRKEFSAEVTAAV